MHPSQNRELGHPATFFLTTRVSSVLCTRHFNELRFIFSSGVPIYLQLMEQIKHAVETGAIREGEQLPTIRKIAEELTMNPNTVARAYRELEHEGVIEVRHGSGAFIAEPKAPRKRSARFARRAKFCVMRWRKARHAGCRNRNCAEFLKTNFRGCKGRNRKHGGALERHRYPTRGLSKSYAARQPCAASILRYRAGQSTDFSAATAPGRPRP